MTPGYEKTRRTRPCPAGLSDRQPGRIRPGRQVLHDAFALCPLAGKLAGTADRLGALARLLL